VKQKDLENRGVRLEKLLRVDQGTFLSRKHELEFFTIYTKGHRHITWIQIHFESHYNNRFLCDLEKIECFYFCLFVSIKI